MDDEKHNEFGAPCGNSRWFNQEPVIEVTPVQSVMERWYCPIDGCSGQMHHNGIMWPTGNPGYHHVCDECGFTAAITGAAYPRQSVRSLPTEDGGQ